ncbi:MAG: hypothetical protein H7833_16950 [Magnetococcus sp. DMHC-1]
MVELQESQLQFLNEKKSEDYASWFLDGFKDWFNPAYRHTAFNPIHYALSPDTTPFHEQLAEVYAQLSGSGRKAFSSGVTRAIQDCPRRPEWTETLWYLVQLGVVIRAKSVLKPIKKILLDKYRTHHGDSATIQSLAQVINALAYWKEDTDLIPFWEELLGYKYLSENDASLLFLALCREKPTKFPKYLRMASFHFARLDITQSFPRYLIEEFSAIVSSEIIAKKICELSVSLYQAENRMYFDNWFLKALTSEMWSPYRILNRRGFYILIASDDLLGEGIKISIKPSGKKLEINEDFYNILQTISAKSSLLSKKSILNHKWNSVTSCNIDKRKQKNDFDESKSTGLQRLVTNLISLPKNFAYRRITR